ncbi:NUDIX hydrolase [Aeromicrobium phragmitis]|uniref:NUDIX hydrolase n=1 Tax=Aeromicrobium phragmitis TaxID=2478914 RepID=A0A3L8PNW8_9ACTN|nr:NUDIX hydrolase [Aeromicrobium phragmitis]
MVNDPPIATRDGFIAILNAGLPRKRVIGQGLLRDERGRYLLCELTYKREWDLPGGVVEVGESPATGLVRELHEELGIAVEVQQLVTMNWLPPWRGWDDACLFVFDLGTVSSEAVQAMALQRSEIKAVHWCDLDTVRERATGATAELLEAVETGTLPAYREAPLQPE